MTKTTTKREAFVAVLMGRQIVMGGAFGIGLAQENERGYYPQVGFGSFDTYEAASAKAQELNALLGLSADEAAMIVCSSMRKQNQEKRAAKEAK